MPNEVLLDVLWSELIHNICNNIADLVANETSDSSKSVTDVITDTFTIELITSKNLPANEKIISKNQPSGVLNVITESRGSTG